MHAGYSLWCSLSMYEYSPFTFFRALAVIYPFLTLYCIVVTANHFFLDAALGVVCYYVALKLTGYLPKVGRGSGVDLLPCGVGGAASASSAAAATDIAMDEEALIPVTLADLQQQENLAGNVGNTANSLLKKR